MNWLTITMNTKMTMTRMTRNAMRIGLMMGVLSIRNYEPRGHEGREEKELSEVLRSLWRCVKQVSFLPCQLLCFLRVLRAFVVIKLSARPALRGRCCPRSVRRSLLCRWEY